MLTVLRLVTMGAVIASWLPASGVAAQAVDPWIGTWDLDLAKSRFSPGPAPKAETRTYEAAVEGEKVTIKGVDAEGKPTLIQASYKYDGKEYAVTGSPDVDAQALKRTDASTITGTLKKAGNVVMTATRTVSKDGKVMTITFIGKNAKGQTINNVLVFHRH